VVLHVIPQVYDFADVPLDRAMVGPELRRQIDAARARVAHDSTHDVREEILWGDAPAAEILRFIQEQKADLVVLGTHGHGAFKRALIGSVAASVARSASCPVLLVPPALWKSPE
jgi:nucleotide-binding universal stress UspA family protein